MFCWFPMIPYYHLPWCCWESPFIARWKIRIVRAEKVLPSLECLPNKPKGPISIPYNHIRSWMSWCVLIIPALVRLKQENSWGSQVSQLRLLHKICTTERSYNKKEQKSKKMAFQERQLVQSNDLHMNTSAWPTVSRHACVHASQNMYVHIQIINK